MNGKSKKSLETMNFKTMLKVLKQVNVNVETTPINVGTRKTLFLLVLNFVNFSKIVKDTNLIRFKVSNSIWANV